MKTFITSFLASVLCFFLPIQGILIAVGAAIALDTATGVFKAKKLGGWKSVSSRKASDVVGKILLYNIAVITLYVMDNFMLSEFFKMWFSVDYFFTKVAALVLMLIELKSIIENFEAAFKVDIWQLLMALFKRSKDVKDEMTNLTK